MGGRERDFQSMLMFWGSVVERLGRKELKLMEEEDREEEKKTKKLEKDKVKREKKLEKKKSRLRW